MDWDVLHGDKRTVSFSTFSLPNVLLPTAACNFSTSELQKVLRDRQFFMIFISKCVFRGSSEQFFNSRTARFLAISLLNVLFATTACNFSTSELQKVVPDCQFLRIALPHLLFASCNFSTSELQKKVLPGSSVSLRFSLPNVLFATAACNF